MGLVESGAVQLWLTPPLVKNDEERTSPWTTIALRTSAVDVTGVWYMDEAYASHKVKIRLDGLEYEFPKTGGVAVEFRNSVELEIQAVGLHSLVCRVYQYGVESRKPLGSGLKEGNSFWSKAAFVCRGLLRVGGGVSLHEWMLSNVSSYREFKPGRMDIVTSSAALLPTGGRNTLRMLEALGDAAITRYLARCCLERGVVVGQYQDLRSSLTSNVALPPLFVKNFEGMVRFAAGVNSSSGVGAKAYEAIVGAVDEELGDEGVVSFLVATGFAANAFD